MHRSIIRIVSSALLFLFATTTGLPATYGEQSLYDRLGGKKAIVAVVDEFVARVGADKRINGFFKDTAADPKRMAKFKGNLVDQICQGSGGPCIQGRT